VRIQRLVIGMEEIWGFIEGKVKVKNGMGILIFGYVRIL
jgi:hypothetical protein